MSDITIDEDRVEKLPLWARELIYALGGGLESARYREQQAVSERNKAENALHRYLTDTTGPADSDTFLSRDQAENTDDEYTPDLGLGRGAQVSFHAPALNRGDEAPSIQAQIRHDRLVLTTDFGNLAVTYAPNGGPAGRIALAITIVD